MQSMLCNLGFAIWAMLFRLCSLGYAIQAMQSRLCNLMFWKHLEVFWEDLEVFWGQARAWVRRLGGESALFNRCFARSTC